MEQQPAQVLNRQGNWAVVQLPGRRFPGICVQGDTFAFLHAQFAKAARALRNDPADADAVAELDSAVDEMRAMVGFYEQTLADRHIRLPY